MSDSSDIQSSTEELHPQDTKNVSAVGFEKDIQPGLQNMQIGPHDSQEMEEGNKSESTHINTSNRNIQINQGGDHAQNIQSCGVVNIYNGPVVIGSTSEANQVGETRKMETHDEGQNCHTNIDDGYQDRKNTLKKELIDYYSLIGLTSTPISILFDDEGIDVDELFVMPELEVRNLTRSTTRKDTKIVTVEGILQRDGKSIKRACIVGDAGYGKTFLCKKVVSSWCKIHSDEQTKKLVDTDISFLESFDFLFYIPLRNCKMPEVIEMIKEHIVRKALHNTLQEILDKESEKCLIILDGLDEYSSSVGMPIIDAREKFSIILTSRPWKIEMLRPNRHDLGQELILGTMQQNDAFIKALVESLNERFDEQKDWKKFKGRKEYEKMKHFAKIPVMLIHMVCMWYDGENVGNTQTEIYKEMLEYLFKVAHKRRPKELDCMLQRHAQISNKDGDYNLSLLNNLRELSSGEKIIISKLADLAYHTLFCERKEEALIFSHDDMDIYNLSKEEVEFCLSVGLLSQEKINRKVTKKEKLLSFIHKTYQEFLAAFYIACHYEDIFHKMLKSLASVDKVLEMRMISTFLVGLKPIVLNELSMHIGNLVENDEGILGYRKPLTWQNLGPIHIIQSFICDCFVEFWGREAVDIPLIELRDVYIDRYTVSNRIWEMIPFINVQRVRSLCVFSDKKVFVRGNMEQLEKLALEVNTQKDIDIVSNMISCSKSHFLCLDLRGPFAGLKADASELFSKLSMKKSLTALKVKDLELSMKDMTQLGNLFVNFDQLQDISLKDIRCTSRVNDDFGCSLDLRHNTNLRYLKLSRLDLDGDILLDEHAPLEYVEIDSLKRWIGVVKTLKHSVTLKHLLIGLVVSKVISFQENYTLSHGKVFTEALPTFNNLESFRLRHIDLQDEDLTISIQTGELMVFLSDLIMTLHCVKKFVDSLIQSSSKKVVHMLDVYIHPERDLPEAAQYIRDYCYITRDDTKLDTGGYIHMTFTNNK